MGDVAGGSENYDSWGNDEKAEYGVVKDAMDTSIARACRAKAISA